MILPWRPWWRLTQRWSWFAWWLLTLAVDMYSKADVKMMAKEIWILCNSWATTLCSWDVFSSPLRYVYNTVHSKLYYDLAIRWQLKTQRFEIMQVMGWWNLQRIVLDRCPQYLNAGVRRRPVSTFQWPMQFLHGHLFMQLGWSSHLDLGRRKLAEGRVSQQEFDKWHVRGWAWIKKNQEDLWRLAQGAEGFVRICSASADGWSKGKSISFQSDC